MVTILTKNCRINMSFATCTTSFETASISLSPYIRGPKDKRDWTFGFQNQTREDHGLAYEGDGYCHCKVYARMNLFGHIYIQFAMTKIRVMALFFKTISLCILVEIEVSDMLHSEAPPVQLFIITRFPSLLKRKKEMKNMPPDFGPRRFSTDSFVTSAMCKRSSAPFIERHCFHGMMSNEGATHMVLWWGFVLCNHRVGTDN